MITVTQLINYCNKALGLPYWYGCFGQISTESLYNTKKKQYPSQYRWKLPEKQLNKRVFDCVGLIKGAIWSNGDFSKNPQYVPSQDVSANGMKSKCKNVQKLPSTNIKRGALVFKAGHVGVYIGDGYVIEAMGHKYGVKKTKLNERPFTHFGYCPWIDYGESLNESKDKYYEKCKSSFTSIVDALDSIKVDSRFSYRKKIAAANGIKNYSGTYQQNIDMLNMLKAGKLKKV